MDNTFNDVLNSETDYKGRVLIYLDETGENHICAHIGYMNFNAVVLKLSILLSR